MKQLSSMTTGPACSGSSTPPMPAPPEIWQFLPIWAQEPTVAQVSIMVPLSTRAPTLTKHGMSTTPGAMKAERRTTQFGHGAEAGVLEAVGAPAREFRRHLVVPGGLAGALETAAAGDRRGVVEAEGEQHGLLQPLARLPLAGLLFGDAQLAFVEAVERRLDGVADLAPGAGTDSIALLPGGVDDRLQLFRIHGFVPVIEGLIAVRNMRQGRGGVNVADCGLAREAV